MVFLTSSCNCWHYLPTYYTLCSMHAFPALLLLSLSHHYKLVYHIKNLLFQPYPSSDLDKVSYPYTSKREAVD
jgi:hypothetical protein